MERTSDEITIVAAIRGAVYNDDDDALYILARRILSAKIEARNIPLQAQYEEAARANK